MNASDTTPSSGECVSEESIDYQQLGQTLLRGELERHADDLAVTFRQKSIKIERGDGLDGADVAELLDELHQARVLVEAVQESLQ